MEKLVGLFSGQGSQYNGMGKNLYDNFAKAKEVYDCGSDILKINLADISFNGDDEMINRTLNSQPAIFAHSVAAYTVASDYMKTPDAVAGHSLGEIAALWAAGAYRLEDGFRLIGARAKAMDIAAEKAKGIMVAILGVDYETIISACKASDGFVLPANLNLSTQTVISGEEKAVEAVVEQLLHENKRAKGIKLGVSSAFHTSMMAPAAVELIERIRNISFNQTKIPFFSNVTGDLLVIEDYPNYFSKQMVSPVHFTGQVKAMVDYGVTKAVEFGPKKTVATLVKKNCKNIAVANIDTAEDLEVLKAL